MREADSAGWAYEDDCEELAVLHEPLPAGMLEEMAFGPLVEMVHNPWAVDDEDEVTQCVHTCPVCGTDFFDRRNKLYCSRSCQKKAYKLRRRGLLDPVYFPELRSCKRRGKRHKHPGRDEVIQQNMPNSGIMSKGKKRSWKDNWLWLW